MSSSRGSLLELRRPKGLLWVSYSGKTEALDETVEEDPSIDPVGQIHVFLRVAAHVLLSSLTKSA
jgi:hypothetical protein